MKSGFGTQILSFAAFFPTLPRQHTSAFLPPAYVVRREVMFLQVSVNTGGGYPGQGGYLLANVDTILAKVGTPQPK